MRRLETLPLGERIALEALLADAYSSLGQERAAVSPLRVRAAVRWGRGQPPSATPWSRVLRRLAEASIAACATLAVFTSALPAASTPIAPEHDLDQMRIAQRPYVVAALDAYHALVARAVLSKGPSAVQGLVELRRLAEPPAFDPEGLDRYAYLAAPVRTVPASPSAAR